jgi:hypothetical protein
MFKLSRILSYTQNYVKFTQIALCRDMVVTYQFEMKKKTEW